MTNKGKDVSVRVTAALELPEDLWGCGEMIIDMLAKDEYDNRDALFNAVKELVMEDVGAFMESAHIDVTIDIPGPGFTSS